MKKLLLLLILFFSTTILTAQNFNQPTQYNNVCDGNGDGFATFYLGEITYEILGNLSSQDYTITHYATNEDAQSATNPLPGSYTNTTVYSQTLYARIVTVATGQFQVFTYQLNVVQANQGDSYTLTKCSSAACWNLNDIGFAVTLGQSGSSVTYFLSEANAVANSNPIPEVGCFVHPLELPSVEVYYRVDHLFSSECPNIGTLHLVTQECIPCQAPTQLAAFNITSTSAIISWVPYQNQSSVWTVSLSANGGAPTVFTTVQQQSSAALSGLLCDTTYAYYVTSNCISGDTATAGPFYFSTLPCVPQGGQPVSLTQCSDNGVSCFNLTPNTQFILGSLNPSEYTVSYYTTQANATNATVPITTPENFCSIGDQVIYARLENNTTHVYQILPFELIVNTVTNQVTTLASMDQCDDNSDSAVIFNLTNAQAQINSNNTLAYYTSLGNAQNQVAPIANPTVYSIGVQTAITTIFIRETVLNSCDNIYSFQARTYAICNLASTCSQANSLCGALGTPFANTHQGANAESGINYGCLGSQPNPTWFYLPVSGNGTINLKIEQNAALSFTGTGLDVDYIVYGPFANSDACGPAYLNAATTVSCSFSPNVVEFPIIPNAQIGQYYKIMVTNYSNQEGYIRITELSNTVGAISCSGIRLNTFLDSNGNGTQETGEVNFPLGQFTYEVNTNGNVHNITAPSGVYNIYDANTSNSYQLTYAVDSSYSSLYNVSTASYSNVHVTGTGMTVYNFPVTAVQPYNDLAVNIVPINAPRPGFVYQEKIIYTNNGNQTIASGTITFNKDALVTITGNTQTGTTQTANGFTFNFLSLLPFETRTITVSMTVPTLPTVTIGNLLTSSVSIAPLTGDVVPANNSASNSQIIIGSYDPNDKMESHGEKILYSSFTSNDYLYYTIRFENSGTASAIDVRVNDVLDSRLDETSVKMINSSHPYVLDRLDNNLNWKFANIQLPPSVANTATGKGYVTFRVKPKAGYAKGDIIPNTASIYFDFNPAIVTNTFRTEFVQQLDVAEFENGDFVFYPNPVSDIVTISLKNNGSIANVVVYDILGKMIISQKPNGSVSTQTLDLSQISKGIYLLEVTTDTNLKVVKKFLIE